MPSKEEVLNELENADSNQAFNQAIESDTWLQNWTMGECEAAGVCEGMADTSGACLKCRKSFAKDYLSAPARSDGYTSASTRSAHEAVMGAIHNLLD